MSFLVVLFVVVSLLQVLWREKEIVRISATIGSVEASGFFAFAIFFSFFFLEVVYVGFMNFLGEMPNLG